MTSIKNSKAYIFISLLILFTLSTQAADKKDELTQLRSKIEQQNSSLKQRTARLNALAKQSKNVDSSLNKISSQQRKTQQQLTKTQKRMKLLKQQAIKLGENKTQQQNALAAQIETAYMAGDNDYLKLLLNQDEARDIERNQNYYQHLYQARIKAISDLKKTIKAIDKNNQDQKTTQQRLIKSKAAQKKLTAQLAKQKQQQKNENNKIRRSIRSEKQTLAALKSSENKLKQQITKIKQQQAINKTKAGLQAKKGKLPWPIKGKVLHSYNSKRFSNVRWQGLVISAKEGSKVRAIAAGKVVFADWLRGFGMVVIVDHGKSFLSLYGHNQTLLRNSGEYIKAGETISLAGRSGGQTLSSLYFEIRQKGKPVNPRRWLKR